MMTDDFSDILADPTPSKPGKSGKPKTKTGGASVAAGGTGKKIQVTIIAENWDGNGGMEELNCGTFEQTGKRREGQPSTISVEGTSVPLSAPVRREKHTRPWEETTMQAIVSDIAGRGGLSLVWELDDDPQLDRADQRQQSDLAYLTRLAKDHGASVKVSDNKLVVFSEEKYEGKAPVLTIKKGDKRLLSYSFLQDSSDTASSATATYKDPKSGKFINETFSPPTPPAVGNALIVNARPYMMSGDRYRETK